VSGHDELRRSVGPKHLKAGDILFKHASASAISRAIKKGQKTHYHDAVALLQSSLPKKPADKPEDDGRTVLNVRPDPHSVVPSVDEAINITHMAVALGPDDVAEFDEGGASKLDIAFKSNYGFVRGPMSLSSRLGNTYEVYRCTSEGLWSRAADKASLIWDLTHTDPAAKGIQDKTPLTASYGVKKVLKTALLKSKGPDLAKVEDFEKILDDWLTAADNKNAGKKADVNLQFFCSNFVMYCYLWAAAEWQAGAGTVGGLDYALGRKAAISPTEVYVRIRAAGKQFFRYAGHMKT
jgi:hypothetical protein